MKLLNGNKKFRLLKNKGNEVSITVKNYKLPKGMSMAIHNLQLSNNELEFKGPMGVGFEISQPGVYIAFTAGTGCLGFLDLVAFTIRKFFKVAGKKEGLLIKDKSNFKFLLFISFKSKEEAIAIDLLESFDQICKQSK